VRRARPGVPAAVLTAWILGGCGGGSGSVAQMRFAPDAPPYSYVASYEQDVEWGAAEIERRYGARVTIPASTRTAAAADGRIRARLDSLGVAITIHGGRQAFDTRHLAGAELEMRIPPGGGPPTYFGDVPALEIGMLEGRVSLDRLLDLGFPDLPPGPAAVGDRWSAEWTRPMIEAHVAATATITVDYELAGWDTIDGVECARIEGRLTGPITAGSAESEADATRYSGTVEGTLTWHFDPEAGSVVAMAGETASDGTLTVSGNDSRVRQVTRIRIERRDG
jgi:hypothetical protein